jgi:hypothetical protein
MKVHELVIKAKIEAAWRITACVMGGPKFAHHFNRAVALLTAIDWHGHTRAHYQSLTQSELARLGGELEMELFGKPFDPERGV